MSGSLIRTIITPHQAFGAGEVIWPAHAFAASPPHSAMMFRSVAAKEWYGHRGVVHRGCFFFGGAPPRAWRQGEYNERQERDGQQHSAKCIILHWHHMAPVASSSNCLSSTTVSSRALHVSKTTTTFMIAMAMMRQGRQHKQGGR